MILKLIFTWLLKLLKSDFIAPFIFGLIVNFICWLNNKIKFIIINKTRSSLKISPREIYYNKVMRYIVDKKLISSSTNNFDVRDYWDGERYIAIKIPSDGLYKFTFNKSKGYLSLYKNIDDKENKHIPELELIFPLSFNKNLIDELLEEVNCYDKINKNNTVDIYTYTSSWVISNIRNKRSMNTVFLKDDIKTDLLEDLSNFLNNKDIYLEKGILFKRGYLLYGEPGTGKTSTVLAIASYLNKDIYSLNLNSLSDTTLIQAFNNIPTGSMVLLEDIDAMNNVVKERENKIEVSNELGLHVTLSTLLNVLDGAYSKEDTVLFMTTNHIEVLDAALLRRGRVDYKIEYKHLDKELVSKAYDLYYPEHPKLKNKYLGRFNYPISATDIQDDYLQNPNKPKL